MSDHDKAIVEANSAIGNLLAEYAGVFREMLDRLNARDAAITASIVAQQAPALLTAREALMRQHGCSNESWQPSASMLADMQAVLDAAHERALKVIEGLAKHEILARGNHTTYSANCVSLLDIRTALKGA